MARQQGDAAEHALVEEIRLLGNKTNRVRIDQLGVDQGIEIDAQKRRIHKRAFDRLDAEKHILPSDRPAVLEAHILANLESVNELVLRYFGPRRRNRGFQLQGFWIARQQSLKDVVQHFAGRSVAAGQRIEQLRVAEAVDHQPITRHRLAHFFLLRRRRVGYFDFGFIAASGEQEQRKRATPNLREHRQLPTASIGTSCVLAGFCCEKSSAGIEPLTSGSW